MTKPTLWLLRIDPAASSPRTASCPGFVALLLALLLVASGVSTSLVSAAEIAILKSADMQYYNQATQAFRTMLPPDTTVTEYNLMGDLAQGRTIASSLRGAPPDLVLAVGLKAALAAKLELVDTPAVFCLVLDPESHGLPGPNMRGILMRVPPATQLASIQSLAPHARRIGLLYDPTHTEPLVREATQAARKLGLSITAVAVHDASDVPPALHSLLPNVDLFWLLQDKTVVTHETLGFILRTTLESKVPVFGFSPTLVQQGALGALVVDAKRIGQQAGTLARAILRDRNILHQLLEDPVHPQLAINLASAEYFGMRPTRDILRLATVLYGSPGAVAHGEGALPLIP